MTAAMLYSWKWLFLLSTLGKDGERAKNLRKTPARARGENQVELRKSAENDEASRPPTSPTVCSLLGYNPGPHPQWPTAPTTALIQWAVLPVVLSPPIFLRVMCLHSQLFLGSQNEEMLHQHEGGGTNGHMGGTI